MRASFVALSALSLPAVMAWGPMGHQTVALIAQHLLTPQAKTWVNTILGETKITDAAIWPDSWRKEPGNEWSSHFHYIDAKDNPPNQCGVNFERDCPPEGCIVTAIGNYTQRVQDTKLDAEQRLQALKFVIHFFGDIAQPLHTENLEIGGNGINVTFDGQPTNLHQVWDSKIAERVAGNQTVENAEAWSKRLCARLYKNEFGDRKGQEWNCLDIKSAEGAQKCAMVFANDTNQWICKSVLYPSIEAVANKELGGDYAKKGEAVVERQIARAGYRLALWLNSLAKRSSYQ